MSRYEGEIKRLVALHPHCRAEVTPAEVLCARGRPRSVPIDAARIMALRPCGDWPADRVTALIGGRTVSLAEVLACEAVPAEDRVWVACQPGVWVAPDLTLRWLAADFAAVVLPVFEATRPGDMRPRRAIEAARLYALGLVSREDLVAAWAAARDAARDDAWAAGQDAARAAGQDAARDAARDAAWAAARDAAWAAARAAARAAAGDAAWSAGVAAWSAGVAAGVAQIRRVLDLLGAP